MKKRVAGPSAHPDAVGHLVLAGCESSEDKAERYYQSG